ncbi:probable protein phosphatase 2C 6 [Cucurbita pepo subsp. pepo]|uniref:probable protein phosphatase 2C 6 n=1 Tax=Cucurbita pepo subsp. pepo TaxID=3664 RepID=UPI000C9D62D8|nr:probable protein phosphatase 2C 6 [Cucurbita pepo subsp. pepo]
MVQFSFSSSHFAYDRIALRRECFRQLSGGEDILFKNFHELLAEEWVRGGSDSGQNGRWEIALTKSSERVDDAFKDKTLAPYSVGSTALVVLLSVCQIIVANCGDSMLCRQRRAIPLTVDQKISRPEEYDRLVKGGVRILFVGVPRVEGVMTMTRAIEDECLILATDGVWDILSNDDVMKRLAAY